MPNSIVTLHDITSPQPGVTPAPGASSEKEPDEASRDGQPSQTRRWYAMSYPDAPTPDSRCLETLASWQPIRNILRYGKSRPDGGIRKAGAGLAVYALPGVELSSYDFDGLTRLVIAAHRYACRVSVSAVRVPASEIVGPAEIADYIDTIGGPAENEKAVVEEFLDSELSALVITIHPRFHVNDSPFGRHPDLGCLAGLAATLDGPPVRSHQGPQL